MLEVQTYQDFRVIVLDESVDPKITAKNMKLCKPLRRVNHVKCSDYNDWGQTAKERAILSLSEHANNIDSLVIVPNDDAYYVPTAFAEFVKGMEGNDMVYCDWLWDMDRYKPQQALPTTGRIDVGGFMTRVGIIKDLGWNDKGPEGDGKLIERIAEKYKVNKAEGILYVKN